MYKILKKAVRVHLKIRATALLNVTALYVMIPNQ